TDKKFQFLQPVLGCGLSTHGTMLCRVQCHENTTAAKHMTASNHRWHCHHIHTNTAFQVLAHPALGHWLLLWLQVYYKRSRSLRKLSKFLCKISMSVRQQMRSIRK